MLWLALTLATLMGVTLGLLGAGGSILTVPILVYILGLEPVTATGYSLLIVGSAAAAGTIKYIQQKQVSLSSAVIFALPAMLMVFISRRYFIPALPETLFGISRGSILMILFSLLMIFVGWNMKRTRAKTPQMPSEFTLFRLLRLVLGSSAVGVLTGSVGAGGGFLIIPALTSLFGLDMKKAVGTSLVIIAINSLIGFQGDRLSGITLDWQLLGPFLLFTLLGILAGTVLQNRVESQTLKQAFGTFTLVMGFLMLAKEVFHII